MKLGADFFRIIQIIKMVIQFLEWFSRNNNEDTPDGEV